MTATLQAADISPQTLRKAAAAAALAAEKGQPVVYTGMDDKAARSALQNHQRHEGKAIAAGPGKPQGMSRRKLHRRSDLNGREAHRPT